MKNIVSIMTLLSAFSASAETSVIKVHCTGTYATRTERNTVQRWNIVVKTNAAANQLEVTRSLQFRQPPLRDTDEYPITASTASSISAKSDLRPEDGALEELTLNISTERVVDPEQPDQVFGRLYKKTTFLSRQSGQEIVGEETRDLACKVESN